MSFVLLYSHEYSAEWECAPFVYVYSADALSSSCENVQHVFPSEDGCVHSSCCLLAWTRRCSFCLAQAGSSLLFLGESVMMYLRYSLHFSPTSFLCVVRPPICSHQVVFHGAQSSSIGDAHRKHCYRLRVPIAKPYNHWTMYDRDIRELFIIWYWVYWPQTLI